MSFDSTLGEMLVDTMLPQESEPELNDAETEEIILPDILPIVSDQLSDSNIATSPAQVAVLTSAKELTAADPNVGLIGQAKSIPLVHKPNQTPPLADGLPINSDAPTVSPTVAALSDGLEAVPTDNETTSAETPSEQRNLVTSPVVGSNQPSLESQPTVVTTEAQPAELAQQIDKVDETELKLDIPTDQPIGDDALTEEFSNADTGGEDSQSARPETPVNPRTLPNAAEPTNPVTSNVSVSQTNQTADVNRMVGGEVAVEDKMVDQIAERIRVEQHTFNQKTETTIEIELDPPELGRARVELTDSENGITAKIVMSREASARVVDSNLDALRESLRESGVDVTEFDVSYEDPSSQNQHGFDDEFERTPQINRSSEPVLNGPTTPRNSRADSSRRIDLTV